MLRKTLLTLTAVAVMGVGSAAMAHSGGGGGGGRGGGGWGGGHAMVRGGSMLAAPTFGGRVQSWGNFSRNHFAWSSHEHFRDRFHRRFHNRFFAFGFGGPYLYDYAYNSCWIRVPAYYGWHWVYACGDYTY
jgi:hypothetical protein